VLNANLGFRPENVIAVQTWLPIPNDPQTDIYRTASQEAPFVREVLRRGNVLPGVEEIAIGDMESLPLGHSQNDLNRFPLIFEGHETPPNQAPIIDAAVVTPGYFQLLRMPLVRGRLFAEFDNDKSPTVTVVNEAFVRAYFPDSEPLGKRLKFPAPFGGSSYSMISIVGVIGDARTETLAETSLPQIYLSLYQRPAKDLAIFVRGRVDTAEIENGMREQVQAVNPELPVFGAQTLSDVVSDSLSERRFSMEVIGLFALTALLLAGLGIYGVIAYIVSERTHEIGIRLAIGAQRSSVLQMILREGLSLALAGAALGLVGALIVSRLMSGLLYGVKPTDPVTFVAVAVVLSAVALVACYIPARRAMRVDPIVALRYE
jgi:predicted permease